MFKKILIANRGEIALRVLRACRELGIKTVAVHSEADARALHVRFADEAVCIGPAAASKSYLNIPAIISAAEITGADAIHPGYGFLSENAEFARICGKCGITFIGPTPEAMRAWGDKVRARENAERVRPAAARRAARCSRAPSTPSARPSGSAIPSSSRPAAAAAGAGCASCGATPRCPTPSRSARHEAEAGFKNPDVYCEKFVERPRHIEFQVLADQHGGVWTLGERECSLQRRHQKVIEEAPSPAMTPEKRQEMAEVIRKAVRETGYTSLGTLEFLMDEKGDLYFLEMNTRVQVEHPVTEMVTGLDLVALQIRAAAGEKLDLPDTRPWSFRGHAIECRINAEDPQDLRPLARPHHRVPPAGRRGRARRLRRVRRLAASRRTTTRCSPSSSSHAPTRAEAIIRMRRALDEFIVAGIRTNIDLHKALLSDHEVVGRNDDHAHHRAGDRAAGNRLRSG